MLLVGLHGFSDDLITDIMDDQKQIMANIIRNYEQFKLCPKKEAVLVIGAIGSGTTALTLLLTGAELRTKKKDGNFIIIDEDNKIAKTIPPISKTIVPNLMIEPSTNTTYYDCPGFSKIRKFDVDIPATLTFGKLLKCIEALKFIFTVTYSSVTPKSSVRTKQGKLL